MGLRLLVLIFVLALAVPAAAAERRPALRVLDEHPVTVAGTGFGARERVVVRVAPTSEPAYSKVVRATITGRFTAVFVERSVPECAGYTITAVGGMGSRAKFRELPPPCGIDPAP